MSVATGCRKLDVSEPQRPKWPLPAGCKIGDWVHTTERVIVPWMAERWQYCAHHKKRIKVFSNANYAEGRLAIGREGRPIIVTGILSDPPEYQWQSRHRRILEVTIYPHNIHAVVPGKRKPRTARKLDVR